MRNALLLFFLCMLFAGCGVRTPVQVPPDEALRRSIVRMMTMESVTIDATGSVVLPAKQNFSNVLFTVTGTLLPLRQMWSMQWKSTVRRNEKSFGGTFLLVSPKAGEVYVKIATLIVPDDSTLLSGSGSSIGRWMLVSSSGKQSSPTGTSGPNAEFVESAMKKISIDAAVFEKQQGGPFVYSLTVHVLPEKSGAGAMPIRGRLMIDARTFVLVHADWIFSRSAQLFGVSETSLHITFRPDEARLLSIPDGTGSLVSPDAIFDMILAE